MPWRKETSNLVENTLQQHVGLLNSRKGHELWPALVTAVFSALSLKKIDGTEYLRG